MTADGQPDGYQDLQVSTGDDPALARDAIDDFVARAQLTEDASTQSTPQPAKARPAPASPTRLVTTVDPAYNYICTVDAHYLPRLTNSRADAYATSALQMFLSEVFYMPVLVDGQYGPRTREVVRQYQRNTGLEPDGLVGPITWSVLQTACECEGPTC